jgi:alpha-beta hydrolase superfamily lysophospholipase
VDLGAYLYSGDPRRTLGMRFIEVNVSSSLGAFPAWFVPGARDTWAVFVHGMTAGRGESLRLLPVVSGLGFPALVITWRNGPGAPRSKDGLYHLGASEWQDLEDAVRHARRNGARRVILFGYSMGGAIVAEFMRRSDLAGTVIGVVLDAPVLDWHAAVQLGAEKRGKPATLLAPLAERIVSLRTGFRWKDSGARAWGEQFRTPAPILLFHGTADRTVPIEPSEVFARTFGDRVTFVTTEGADHVQSWNFDPERYGRTLTEWLNRTAGAASP